MEKLIELHKEFNEESKKNWIIYPDGDERYFACMDSYYDFTEGAVQYLCSKEYGFIERLLKNDKIKFLELKYAYMDLRELVREIDFIIMLLSIQDNPIKFLISILK